MVKKFQLSISTFSTLLFLDPLVLLATLAATQAVVRPEVMTAVCKVNAWTMGPLNPMPVPRTDILQHYKMSDLIQIDLSSILKFTLCVIAVLLAPEAQRLLLV